ncbi:hypothetical protein AB1Y20_006821 [Prymnesium parvum]|uniref:Uncharacterized protein n=1 Tax=Prymnesium parvum TaxID=97485 RepID=A0AB34J1E5_PRYPA
MPSRPPASRRLSNGTRLSAAPLAASPRSDTVRAGCSLSPQPAASKEHEGPSEESGDEVTPPWAISKQRPREAWHETGSRVSSATTTDSPRPSPIPTALLALPRAVVVAAMKQKPTHTPPDASREARREIREWMEQAHLLKQRADILSRSVLPRHLAADKEIAEALCPSIHSTSPEHRPSAFDCAH